MSQAAPTFSSFPDLDFTEESKPKEKRDHKSRKDNHKERNEKASRRRHSRSRSRSRERSSKRQKHESRTEHKGSRLGILDDEKLHSKHREKSASPERGEGSREYYVDKRGDMSNITYGSLNQRDVPKFHRAGRGKVMGLSSVWNITRGSGNKEVEVGRRDRRKVARYSDSKSLKLLIEGPRRLLAIPDKPVTTSNEFIAFSKRKRLEDEDAQDSYRSIEQRKSHDSDSDGSQESSSSSSTSGSHTLTAEQHTIKALEAALTSSPTDINSWLKLLDLSVKSLSILTQRAARARAEISLALLKRAMDAHPDNSSSFRLRLLYVEHGSELWSAETLQNEWERLLSSPGAPQSPPWTRAMAWLNWLEWRLSVSQTVGNALNDAKRVLAMLHSEQFERVRVRLCWRVAIFLRETGFLEQGLALLQAQIELSQFCPIELSAQPLEVRLDALEAFWEAELPRIGEENAKGWAAWEQDDRPDAVEFGRKPSPNVTGIQDPYQRWYCLEKALDVIGALPARSFNEDQQDPYGMIVFSDIRPFLSNIQSPQATNYLRLAFLSFLGLNIPGIAGVNILDDHPENLQFVPEGWMLSGLGGWVSNPDYLFPSVKQQHMITWESHVGTTVGMERPQQSAFGPVKEWVHERSFLEGASLSGEHRTWESSDVQNILTDCVRESIDKLEFAHREDLMAAFDAALDIKGAIKASKQRLEADQSSLTLWSTHARLERVRHKHTEASKIYTMAISLDPQSKEMPLLVADAVEFFWLRDNRTEAQNILSRFLDVQAPFAGLNLLRARKNLYGRATTNNTRGREACLRIRFFLEHSATTIQDAVAALDAELTLLDIHSSLRESLTTWLCLTLLSISKITGSLVPPAVVSKRVNAAIAEYSNNTILLSLFLECERGLGIFGHVRDLLDDSSSTGSVMIVPKALKRIAWEIWAEDWGYAPWEPERVRMKLENAVHLKSINYSVVLWRVYLAFELRVNELERAKAVLFRALGCCPWSKELYAMAFGPLRAVFTVTELNDMISVMVERGLRMRRDVEEFLDGWEDPAMMVARIDEGNEGDAELETLMYDREQAKPY